MLKKDLTVQEFRELMSKGTYVEAGKELHQAFHKFSQRALKITSEINNRYNTPEKIRELFSELTESNVDETFGLFPPFYTDCGINIKIGKNVFINACCKFQDQGGIEIGDGALIGHNVTIATLNHDFSPEKRQNITPKPVKIGKNVWIGSDSTILSGVEIGDDAIIGAGSIVTKSIPKNTIAVGNPAKVTREVI